MDRRTRDGGPTPYRWHVRPPSFINLSVLKELTVGLSIADAIVTHTTWELIFTVGMTNGTYRPRGRPRKADAGEVRP